MKLTIDTERNEAILDGGAPVKLRSPEGFRLVSDAWLKVGFDMKYSYSFSWFGRPLIQLPEDVLRIQEVIWSLQPDVIIETGVAHGGSLILYATLCKAIGKGRVVGVEIALRDYNRQAILSHPLAGAITLVDGSSTAPATIAAVKELVRPGDKVLVILDSNHSRAHVLDELRLYGPIVTPGSYVVATDGLMEMVADSPLGKPEWVTDNPKAAAIAFVAENPDFAIEEPAWPFNESPLSERVTHWPSAYVKRLR